jgi:chromosome transmission fidelity protein 18
VDKYTPKGYADLLSPEHINREVLEWLKAWDTCVFGAKKTPAADAANAPRTLDNHMLSSAMLAPAARKSKKPIQVISADGETDIRPEHKVILLCGPPGLGQCLSEAVAATGVCMNRSSG